MFDLITPEEAGIGSRQVERMISYLERNGYVLHSLLLMKGDSVFGEYYWEPFTADFCHRMYSETKSYVGIAIGLLASEGKLSLDDPIVKFFPDKIEAELSPRFAEQTVRDMLTMRTAVRSPNWFITPDPDRTHEYMNASERKTPAGTIWEYDSAGSQVLSSLVERLAGKTLFDYLDEKIFRHLGTFKSATILKTPNGDSWGDSALLCTPRDMASFIRLLAKGGRHEGVQLIDEGYVKEATSRVTYNHETPFGRYTEAGYGYQIWHTFMDGFAFNGMGGQFSIVIPEKDLIVVATGDNQGYLAAGQLFFSAVEEFLALDMREEPLPADPEAKASLDARTAALKLAVCPGTATSPYFSEMNGKVYKMPDGNPFGWRWFSFSFADGEGGTLFYENAQGKKELPFRLQENVYCKFPQLGYSDGVGGIPTENGFLYDCASSAGWLSERVFAIRAQIIDRYFGNLFMIFAFKGDEVGVSMTANAEHFLDEYQGRATAKRA